MEKYGSITEYLKSENMTKEDLKNYILRASLYLGCECAHLFYDDAEKVEEIFLPLDLFNNIIDNVE